MAVKLFKGNLTSDGLPQSEMAACVAAGTHPNLIEVIGPLTVQYGSANGLLMELVPPTFQPLAGPPSLASCTRDCYAPERQFSIDQLLRIARGAASAVTHLHARGILHGDFYAHNLLVEASGECLLSDFGAASFFQAGSPTGHALQRIEVRAFGHLIEELLQRCATEQDPRLGPLIRLQQECVLEDSSARPSFAALAARLADI